MLHRSVFFKPKSTKLDSNEKRKSYVKYLPIKIMAGL